jgi:hypothetical protein
MLRLVPKTNFTTSKAIEPEYAKRPHKAQNSLVGDVEPPRKVCRSGGSVLVHGTKAIEQSVTLLEYDPSPMDIEPYIQRIEVTLNRLKEFQRRQRLSPRRDW